MCTASAPPASCTTSAMAETTPVPKVITGTKCPSITSTWNVRAPASSSSWTLARKAPKSAARMEGQTCTSVSQAGCDCTPAVSWIGRGGESPRRRAGTGARGVVPFADAPSPCRCRSRPRARPGRPGRRGERQRHDGARRQPGAERHVRRAGPVDRPGPHRLRRQRDRQDRRRDGAAGGRHHARERAPRAGHLRHDRGRQDHAQQAGALRRRRPAASRCRTPSPAWRTGRRPSCT